MFHAYRSLFSAPGTTSFVLAGMLARLPLSMTGIGLITMLSQQRGAYTLAGAV
ncbi:MAG: MFS transporter, partial [Comamonas sp.]